MGTTYFFGWIARSNREFVCPRRLFPMCPRSSGSLSCVTHRNLQFERSSHCYTSHSLTPSLPRSLNRSLTYYTSHSLTYSRTHSSTHLHCFILAVTHIWQSALTWFRNHRSVRLPTAFSNPKMRKKLNRPTRSCPSITSPFSLSMLRPFPTNAIVRTSFAGLLSPGIGPLLRPRVESDGKASTGRASGITAGGRVVTL